MSAAQNSYDVVVVGGGVVGASAALALARAGLDVCLLERGEAPPAFDPGDTDLRVYAISPGSARFLATLGVWPRVAGMRISPYRRMKVWDADPERGLEFDTAGLDQPQLGFIVEDRVLRTALWSALGGVRLRLGRKPAGFRYANGRARLELDDGGTLDAALVVAAEGADSSLREWAGIDTTGWEYPQTSIVCHATTSKPHGETAYQRFLPAGPLAFLPLADGRSSIVWSTESADARCLLELDDAGFAASLGQAIQERLGEITAVTARRAFPLRLLHAESYVQPGLALVGDSAHVVHPLAGQGVNLGLADVEALAEVLTVVNGTRAWTLRVLNRYQRRRKAANLEMLALTDGLFRLFRHDAPAVAAAREAGLFLVNRLGALKAPLVRRAMGL